MFEQVGNLLAGGQGFIKNNPEQFAIMADAIGQNLDPNNPFAGIGSAFGKSSLANTARKKQLQSLASLLGGQQGGQQAPQAPQAGMTPGPVQVPQQQQQPSALGDMNILTPPDQQGPTQMTYKRQPDGSVAQTTTGVAQTPQKPQSMSATDLLPLIGALSGNAADMTGLSPAEIGSIVNQDIALGDVGRKRLADIANQQYQEGTLANETRKAGAYIDAKGAAQLKSLSDIEKNQLDAQLAQAQAPLDRMKILSEVGENRAQTRKYTSEAMEQEVANATEQERLQIVDVLQQGRLDLGQLNDGALMKLFPPASIASMRNTTATRESIERGQRIQNEQDRQKTYASAVANIGKSDTALFAVGDMTLANLNSPDSSDTAWYYNDGKGIFNTEGVKKYTLPTDDEGKAITMKDVRETAETQGVSVQQIINDLQRYEEAKEQ